MPDRTLPHTDERSRTEWRRRVDAKRIEAASVKRRDLPGWLPDSERPRCPWCGKMLKISVRMKTVEVRGDNGELATILFPVSVEYRGYAGTFDRLICGSLFGEQAFKAGFRIEAPKKQ